MKNGDIHSYSNSCRGRGHSDTPNSSRERKQPRTIPSSSSCAKAPSLIRCHRSRSFGPTLGILPNLQTPNFICSAHSASRVRWEKRQVWVRSTCSLKKDELDMWQRLGIEMCIYMYIHTHGDRYRYVHVYMKKTSASNMSSFLSWPNFGPTKLQQVSSLVQRRVANAVRHGPGSTGTLDVWCLGHVPGKAFYYR